MAVQKRSHEALEEEDAEMNNLEQPEDEVASDRSHSSSNGDKERYMLIKLSDVRNEVQCPICLGVIRKTRTVMECLHRFCKECIDKSMRLGNNECPACRTHCASQRSLRDDPNYDALIASIYQNIDKYEEEELALHEDETTHNRERKKEMMIEIMRASGILTWGKNGHRSHNRVKGKNAKNSRISRLVDHLGSSAIDDDEMSAFIMLVSLDEQRIPRLQHPYLSCKPTLTVKNLCQYVALKAGLQVDEVELCLVVKPQASLVSGGSTVDPDKDKLHVVGDQETLAELGTYDNTTHGYLVMAYKRKLPNSDTVGSS